jgi:hypothetical protein
MAAPLSNIKHTTREVNESLKNNCWATLVRFPGEDGAGLRIRDVRTRKGVFEVKANQTGSWHAVPGGAIIYQR